MICDRGHSLPPALEWSIVPGPSGPFSVNMDQRPPSRRQQVPQICRSGHDIAKICRSTGRTARSPGPGEEVLTMRALFRAGALAALVTLASSSAIAADKPFQRDDLADAAVKLEGQIKRDAGAVAKPVAALRREADAAFDRRDRPERERRLAPPRPLHPANQAERRPRARAAAGARRNGRLYRLPTHRQ